MDNSNFGPLSYRAKLIADDTFMGTFRKDAKRNILFAARAGKYSVTINNLDKLSPHNKHLIKEWLYHEGFRFTENVITQSLIVAWNK